MRSAIFFWFGQLPGRIWTQVVHGFDSIFEGSTLGELMGRVLADAVQRSISFLQTMRETSRILEAGRYGKAGSRTWSVSLAASGQRLYT